MTIPPIIVTLILGGIAGWLASLLVGGSGGIIRNVIVGLVGAFVGHLIFAYFGWRLGGPWVNAMAAAVFGGVVVIVIGRFLGR